MQMRCQLGQRNTFPLKLRALLLVKLTKMGVTGKPDKTSPTPKREVFSFSVPWRHTYHLGNLATPLQGGVRASGSFTFSNFVDSLRTNQPATGMMKLSLLKEFIRNLRIIHAPGHFTQHQQKPMQVTTC